MIFRPLRIDYHSRAQECLALEQVNRIATLRVFPHDESRNDDTTCDYSVTQNEGNNANDGGSSSSSSSRDGGIRDANNKGPTINMQTMIDTASQVRTKLTAYNCAAAFNKYINFICFFLYVFTQLLFTKNIGSYSFISKRQQYYGG